MIPVPKRNKSNQEVEFWLEFRDGEVDVMCLDPTVEYESPYVICTISGDGMMLNAGLDFRGFPTEVINGQSYIKTRTEYS